MLMKNKLGYIVLVLFIAQMALILLSWLLTAAFPELPMRSVLSSEGIRWFFGSFVDNLLSPLLIYLITIMIAYGAFLRSRLFTTTRMMLSNIKNRLTNAPQKTYKFHYRESVGLRIVLAELIAYIIIMMLLTTVPHAILLSVTGQLFPSSFSSSFIPSLSFLITIMSLTYGVASGTIDSIANMHKTLVCGLEIGSKLIPTYLAGIQLYMSIIYVLIL